MRKVSKLTHEFVEFVPSTLNDGTLYISISYTTAVHKCCCGCGSKVVTPLSPAGWRLIFDGETVSLHPSIGNWSFACRSHYWVNRNSISWADNKWSKSQIEANRAADQSTRDYHFGAYKVDEVPVATKTENSSPGFFERILKWFFG